MAPSTAPWHINSTAYFGVDPQRNLQFAIKFSF